MSALVKPLRLEIDGLSQSPLPLSLTTVKSHCAIDTTDFDTILQTYMLAAIEDLEGRTHRTFYQRSHTWVLQDFPRGADQRIRLPRGKTQSVESIVYNDSDGNSQTITGPSSATPGTDYREDLTGDDGGIVMPAADDDWPEVEPDHPAPVKINFTSGWATVNVPNDLVNGILIAISDAFERRGTEDIRNNPAFDYPWALVSKYQLVRWY